MQISSYQLAEISEYLVNQLQEMVIYLKYLIKQILLFLQK